MRNALRFSIAMWDYHRATASEFCPSTTPRNLLLGLLVPLLVGIPKKPAFFSKPKPLDFGFNHFSTSSPNWNELSDLGRNVSEQYGTYRNNNIIWTNRWRFTSRLIDLNVWKLDFPQKRSYHSLTWSSSPYLCFHVRQQQQGHQKKLQQKTLK